MIGMSEVGDILYSGAVRQTPGISVLNGSSSGQADAEIL